MAGRDHQDDGITHTRSPSPDVGRRILLSVGGLWCIVVGPAEIGSPQRDALEGCLSNAAGYVGDRHAEQGSGRRQRMSGPEPEIVDLRGLSGPNRLPNSSREAVGF
jgi:hypothetical protein